MPVLDQFANTRDPFMNFRWAAYQMPFGLDSRYVEKVSIPWSRFESIPIYSQGTNSYYSSVKDVDAITVTFYEDVNLTITKMLLKWRELMEKDGYYALPIDYKKNLVFHLLSNTNNTAILELTAQNAWPSAIDNLELAYDSSDRIIISVTFTIDSMSIKDLTTDFTSNRVSSFSNKDDPTGDVRAMLGLTATKSNGSIINDVSTDSNGWSIATNGKTSVNASGWSDLDSARCGYRADENTNTSTGFSFSKGNSNNGSTTTINAGSVVIESYSPDDDED
jgi:hypothetical protein